MKTPIIWIACGLMMAFGWFSCQELTDLVDELSEADHHAVEEMEEAHEGATLYNDSLIYCDESSSCTESFIEYCDSLFHVFDDEYAEHHEDYSHNNVSDDHHHGATSEHHHGDVEHHDEDDDHHGHSIEGHNEMQELRELHKKYHP